MTTDKASATQKILLDFLSGPVTSAPPKGVDLWLLDLAEFADKPPTESSALFTRFVSADELIRANQFKKNSTNFLATRALLRLVLAQYTGPGARELLFARTEHGKPFLSNAAVKIYFNLSHCDDLAVLAVSTVGEVGVDIETASERDYLKIAKRYFHDDELQALHNCAEEERDILFYKLWTLKEAFFKATGGGISTGLDKISFQFDKNIIKAKFASTLFDPVLNVQENDWQFHQEFIADNTLFALVVNSAQAIERRWFDGNSFLID